MYKSSKLIMGMLVPVLAWLSTTVHAQGSSRLLEEIIVSGHVQNRFTHQEIELEENNLGVSDVAELMSRVPGGSINDNGPLSGQAQYRGMFGPRMNVRLDGMYVNSGGPNFMDPPLHYMPVALLDSIEVSRGIASVSYGSGIGGHVLANYKSSQYSDTNDFGFSGEMSIGGHSADDGYNMGGIASFANDTHRLHVLASRDNGNDRSFADGKIRATEFSRNFIGGGYGYRSGRHSFTLDYRYSDTDDSGNPVLPLDIDFFKTHLVKGRYEGFIGAYQIVAQANYSQIDHWMHNYVLRPAPDFSSLPLPPFAGTDRRFVDTDSTGIGYSLILTRDALGGFFNFGLDGHLGEHNASVGDPDVPPFFVTNFDDSSTDNLGFFVEWRGDIYPDLNLEAGLRYNRVDMNTNAVDAQPANLPMASVMGTPPFAVRMLRDAFNNQDRSTTDHNIDWVLKLDYDISDITTFELGAARKVRSPSYLERYLWIPLEVNAGLGDGNNYVGDVGLEPEISHQLELGLRWEDGGAYLAPRVFYRTVDDYIQGIPATNMFVRAASTNANGDANPLRFANVEAEIYGVDAIYGFAINSNWRIDGVFSLTRGKRTDIDDPLYRIAPLNTQLTLKYNQQNWGAAIEGVAYARQSRISQIITANSSAGNTRDIPGYGLVNLYGHYQWQDTGFSIRAGVKNLLDKNYVDPLSGFNRVIGSDVPVGERLRGMGRNFHATLSYRW